MATQSVFVLAVFFTICTVEIYGRTYFATTTKSSWTGVRQECLDKGADLASFKNVSDVEQIWDICESVQGNDLGCHIGYLDSGTGSSNDFYFIDGTTPFDSLGLWNAQYEPGDLAGYDHGCMLPNYRNTAVRPAGLADCTQYASFYGICLDEDFHYIVIGNQDWENHSSGAKREECANDDQTKGARSNNYGDDIGVQCCALDGSSSYRTGLAGGDADGCLIGKTFDEAVAACEDKGDRLCTKAEVESNIGAGEGCSHDARHVWTSDECQKSVQPAKQGEFHLIVIGAQAWEEHPSGDKQVECAADSQTSGESSNVYGDEIGVQCCTQDGSISYRQGLGNDDYNGYNDCLKGVTFDAAKAKCEANGDRLCTKDEIENNTGAGSGCNHDARLVWSSDGCEECDVGYNHGFDADASPIFNRNHIEDFSGNPVGNPNGNNFILFNTNIITISLLITNVFTIIFSLCVCWRCGLFVRDVKYSSVKFGTDSENMNLN